MWYVGVFGDFNLIYWNEWFVKFVGLLDIIVYGMFMMVEVIWVVIDWVGDFGVVVEYGVCFIRLVVVFDLDGIMLCVEGVVRNVCDDGLVDVDFIVTVGG